MKIVVRYKDRVFYDYYYDSDANIIYQKTTISSNAINPSNTAMNFLIAGEDIPAQIQHDPIPHVVLNEQLYRMDYVVAYTVYGNPKGQLRLIHLDNDPMNYEWSNLAWLLENDVKNEYRKIYGVEDLYDIPEEWKPYTLPFNQKRQVEISNRGHVRKPDTKEIIMTRLDTGGYPIIGYAIPGGDARNLLIHRAVAELFVENPNPEEYTIVNHLDGDKTNNYFWNLEWCSPSMNTDHAVVTNLAGKSRRVDESLVHEICRALEKGISPKEISETLGVSKKYISGIYTRKRHVSISSQYTFPNKTFTKEDKSRIELMIKDGMKGVDIAKNMNVPYEPKFISLYERLRRQQRLNPEQK